MKTNYWNRLQAEENLTKEELFFKIRDLYTAFLKHLYNDPKDVPDFRIHFSVFKRTLAEGARKGYRTATLSRSSNEIVYQRVKDAAEIENFENSYTRYQDGVFVMFDFREDGISPLQFITEAFCNELFSEIESYGLRHLKIAHMYELLIYSGVAEFFYGFYRLDINFLHTLCALTYERAYADSMIYIPRFDLNGERRTKKNGLDVAFTEPVMFVPENIRQIRKLLELSDKEVALVVNAAGKVQGLSREANTAQECRIRLWGHMSWTITFQGAKKISYYNARYHIHVHHEESNLFKDLQSIFGKIDRDALGEIEGVVRIAAAQRHGTILIISDPETIERETERICSMKSGTGIVRMNLAEHAEMITYLTSIDGALIMDNECWCGCIGAILDGDATAKGSPARGARYNSTLNYIKRKAELGESYVGIVVSEDGTVDAVTKDRTVRVNMGNG